MAEREADAGAEGAGFGAVLRRHRVAAGLTQEALAERAGLSRRGVQHLEAGDARPYPATLDALAAALALGPEDRARLRAAVPVASPPPADPADDRRGRRPPAAGPANLPLQLTSFVGREDELGATRELVAAHRLVTLTGAGGVGKTRLALEAAGALRPAYPDGVWLVELAALADPALVPQAVAGAVGVREEPDRPLLATLTDALRAKRLLLVLDNCEHLLEACARLADALLRACPDVRVLATSREPLATPGETVWRVPPLAVPETGDSPPVERLTQSEAVRLFVDRARAAQPGFRATPATAPAVAHICRRVDGLPLAIELAAARVRVLPVAQILARLEDRFRLLTGGSRTVLPRQQTLRASLEWSHGLLSEDERVLFRRLAVFAGGWTLTAAEAVGGGAGVAPEEVLDGLTGLVDKSLVVAEGPGDDARYRLLGRPADPARAADPAGAAGDERGLRLALGLHGFWALRGYWSEGSLWLERAVRAGPAPSALRARALEHAGYLASDLGDFRRAEALLAEGVAECRALGDQRGLASALGTLGMVARLRADPAARGLLEEALALARAVGDWREAAASLALLGVVARQDGDYAVARARLEASLPPLREHGDVGMIAWVRNELGLVAAGQGRDDEAGALFRESLAACGGSGTSRGSSRPCWRSARPTWLAATTRRLGRCWANASGSAGSWGTGR
jgi:non-specific serine/threonine protein kinase